MSNRGRYVEKSGWVILDWWLWRYSGICGSLRHIDGLDDLDDYVHCILGYIT
jgi:hypothetical protein